MYGVGEEPDPRFSLANERTFLAWLRTSLALMAGGIAVEAINPFEGFLQTALALVLLVVGILTAATAFGRWAATERAMRTGRPLPAPRLAAVLSLCLVAAGAVAVLLLALR
ncbi:putative membrane protein [Streptoalloteichus hindustanus]|uniref:Putative membrane protein n=1 Tax=Streptoalloteichus hindustanus TaxID=2017 RepID=A0A1M5JU82_STRHI|nr:putative membrane protein [Streptoalloteichus hindustanus]